LVLVIALIPLENSLAWDKRDYDSQKPGKNIRVFTYWVLNAGQVDKLPRMTPKDYAIQVGINCEYGKLKADIGVVDSKLNGLMDPKTKSLLIKFDELPVESIKFDGKRVDKVGYILKPKPFVSELFKRKKLVLTVRDADGTPYSAAYELTALSAYRAKLQAAGCTF
jgi:hypothetical protein